VAVTVATPLSICHCQLAHVWKWKQEVTVFETCCMDPTTLHTAAAAAAQANDYRRGEMQS